MWFGCSDPFRFVSFSIATFGAGILLKWWLESRWFWRFSHIKTHFSARCQSAHTKKYAVIFGKTFTWAGPMNCFPCILVKKTSEWKKNVSIELTSITWCTKMDEKYRILEFSKTIPSSERAWLCLRVGDFVMRQCSDGIMWCAILVSFGFITTVTMSTDTAHSVLSLCSFS